MLDAPLAAVGCTVRVDSDAYGMTLKNVATSTGSSPCQADDLADLSAQRLSSRALAVGPAAFTRAAAADDELCPTTTTHKTPPKPHPPTPPTPPNLPNTGAPGWTPSGSAWRCWPAVVDCSSGAAGAEPADAAAAKSPGDHTRHKTHRNSSACLSRK